MIHTRKSRCFSVAFSLILLTCFSGMERAYALWWKSLSGSSYSWIDGPNWNSTWPEPTYPDDIGAVASFPAWTNAGHSISIGLSKAITVGHITRDTMLNNEDLTLTSGPLIFCAYGGKSTITVNHGNINHDTTFSCNMILSNNLEIISVSSSAVSDNRVHLNGTVSGSSMSILARSTGPSVGFVRMQQPVAATYSGGLILSNIVLEVYNANGLGSGNITGYNNVRIEFEGTTTVNNNSYFLEPVQLAQVTNAPVTLNGILSCSSNLVLETVATSGEGAAGNPITLAGASPNVCNGTVVLSRSLWGSFAGDVMANKNGAFGSALSVTVQSNVCLTITDSGGADDRIADSTSVYLTSSGSVIARVSLSPGVTETVGKLYFNGTPQRTGTWGSSSSSAANKDDTWFSGSGILNVLDTGLPKKGTLIIVR